MKYVLLIAFIAVAAAASHEVEDANEAADDSHHLLDGLLHRVGQQSADNQQSGLASTLRN